MAVVPKTPEGLQLNVGEELRAGRVETLRHVAQIAELQARMGASEQRWADSQAHRSALKATAVTAIVTAIGTLVYLLLSHHG